MVHMWEMMFQKHWHRFLKYLRMYRNSIAFSTLFTLLVDVMMDSGIDMDGGME